MGRISLIYLILSLLFIPAQIFSQQAGVSASEALQLFEKEEYTEAAEMYKKLLKGNDRNHNYNYYYGVSLYYSYQEYSEAIKRLQFAANRAPSPKVHFYLGRLLQKSYEMEAAIKHYERFLSLYKGSDKEELTHEVRRYIDECISGAELINKHFSLTILKKDTVLKSDILSYYNLSDDAGELMKAGVFFRMGVEQDQIIFRTEKGDEVFFPIKGNSKDYDLYKIIRLIDSWTEPEPLPSPISSNYNDLYPFLLIDGTTLYFSSDRPGGLGGFDIYQSFYDPETGSYSEPSNLGPPFNSADDDFLLVPDSYSGKAWFTTNRGLPDSLTVVVEIVWDSSVIRHFTEDINQIKTIANLPISEQAVMEYFNIYDEEDSGTAYAEDKDVVSFNFYVNDTLLYQNFEDFVCSEALEYFTQGYQIEFMRDSLEGRLINLRDRYASSYNKQELKQLSEEIVTMEQKVYSLDDEINGYYRLSRIREIEKILLLMQKGEYLPPSSKRPSSEVKSISAEMLDQLNKSEFTFYSDEDFSMRQEYLGKMYSELFDNNEQIELFRSDSLYVWANSLSLESARLLESTHNMTEIDLGLRHHLSNKDEKEDEIDNKVKKLLEQSKELKHRSLELYEQALDQKFLIYYPKAQEIGATSKNTGSERMLDQVVSNFSEAEVELKTLTSYNPERIERLLALKRAGVDMMEESFLMLMAGVPIEESFVDDTESRFWGSEGYMSSSNQSLQNDRIVPSDKEAALLNAKEQSGQVVADAFAAPGIISENDENVYADSLKDMTKPEYKIQIGVYRNKPDAAVFSKIPDITSEFIPESGLTKYYSGSWRKYEDAAAMVNKIREAGFSGAFIVAFINGQPINIQKAKELE